jgi:hypothetical protein
MKSRADTCCFFYSLVETGRQPAPQKPALQKRLQRSPKEEEEAVESRLSGNARRW